MNPLTWTISCFISFSLGNSAFDNNYFEGRITYKHEIVSKNSELDSSLLIKILGRGSTLFFKEGNFLHKYDGGLFKQDLYNKKNNKIYITKVDSDTTFWSDCGMPGDTILNFSFTPKKEKILGIDCDELIIYFKNKTESDYYNSDSIRINPDWLKNFKFDGENLIDQKEKAIFLKHKTEYPNFILVETATGFYREKLDESIFEIAPNQILIEQK